MLLDELKLVLRGRSLEQTLEVTQAPNPMTDRQLAGSLHVGGSMFGGQLQETLQHLLILRQEKKGGNLKQRRA